MKFSTVFLFIIFTLNVPIKSQVKVKMYDHRAEHDSKSLYGTGPWRYLGYGYGIEYQYQPNGQYQREKGYGFLKTFGRDFCKYNNYKLCRLSNPKFFQEVKNFNNGEPFWGHPSPDITTNLDKYENQHESSPNAKWLK